MLWHMWIRVSDKSSSICVNLFFERLYLHSYMLIFIYIYVKLDFFLSWILFIMSLSAGWFWWVRNAGKKHQILLRRFTWAPFWVPSIEKGPDWTPALKSPCGAKRPNQTRRLCLGLPRLLALHWHQLRASWPIQRQWRKLMLLPVHLLLGQMECWEWELPLTNEASQRALRFNSKRT